MLALTTHIRNTWDHGHRTIGKGLDCPCDCHCARFNDLDPNVGCRCGIRTNLHGFHTLPYFIGPHRTKCQRALMEHLVPVRWLQNAQEACCSPAPHPLHALSPERKRNSGKTQGSLPAFSDSSATTYALLCLLSCLDFYGRQQTHHG